MTTATFDQLYPPGILGLAGNIGRLGRLPAPDGTATAVSRLCGSEVTVDVSLRDGVVADYAQDVQACALGQAAASALAHAVVGATPAELRELRETMRQMLKEGGPPPSGRFGELAVLEGARDYRARHPAILLPFDALVEALGRAEARVASS